MKNIAPAFLMGGLFVLIDSLALLVARPFEAAGMVAFENPNDPMNIVFFFLTLLLFTVAILLIAKFLEKTINSGHHSGGNRVYRILCVLSFVGYGGSRDVVVVSLHNSCSCSDRDAC